MRGRLAPETLMSLGAISASSRSFSKRNAFNRADLASLAALAAANSAFTWRVRVSHASDNAVGLRGALRFLVVRLASLRQERSVETRA